ncbi:MAG: hypothetical protein HGA65_08550, partial [Oscillochloris sp.]|nr:hypothetical protein [Oscillochloris sp.]
SIALIDQALAVPALAEQADQAIAERIQDIQAALDGGNCDQARASIDQAPAGILVVWHRVGHPAWWGHPTATPRATAPTPTVPSSSATITEAAILDTLTRYNRAESEAAARLSIKPLRPAGRATCRAAAAQRAPPDGASAASRCCFKSFS